LKKGIIVTEQSGESLDGQRFLNVILITLYLLIVWLAYIFIYITDQITYICLLMMFSSIIIYLIVKYIMNILKWRTIMKSVHEVRTAKRKRLAFIISSFVCFACMMIWYIGYYPGSFSADSIWQYEQAVTGIYNDWHPVWHTLLFFTFPLSLTGKPGAIVLFQIIYFSLIIGYMGKVIYEYTNTKILILSLIYILLNPYTGYVLLYPWKDVAFSISGLLSMSMAIEIYFTNGRWVNNSWKCIVLGITLANTTLFRHNGILFSLFLIIALFFHLQRQWFKICLSFIVIILLIKGPIYHIFNVTQPDNRVTESVGLPLTIIGNVVKETPNAMDEELSEFAYSIAQQKVWEKSYICGNYNSIKWNGAKGEIIEEKGILPILKLTFKCFIYSPKASFRALFSLTDMVYGLEDNGLEGDITSHISENTYDIVYSGNKVIAEFLQCYQLLMTKTFLKYFRSVGFSMLLMLFAMMSGSNLESWEDRKKTLLCMPIFIYNFGTMCLLTGPDSRFFYISFLVCPLVIIVAIVKRENITIV